MHIEVTTEPTVEPVSLAMAKGHLQIKHERDNAKILRLIKKSREMFENETGRALVTQTVEIIVDAREGGRSIVIPRRPFSSITSFEYYDTSGALTAFVSGTDYYTVGTNPMRIVSLGGTFLPLRTYGAFKIIGTAGYGNPEDVPADIRETVLKILADSFNNPESSQEGFAPIVTELPDSAQYQLAKYHTLRLY